MSNPTFLRGGVTHIINNLFYTFSYTHIIMTRVAYQVGFFRSVSVGITRYLPYRYRRKTWSVFLVSKFCGGPSIIGGPLFPPKLTVQQYRPKNADTGCIWYQVNTNTSLKWVLECRFCFFSNDVEMYHTSTILLPPIFQRVFHHSHHVFPWSWRSAASAHTIACDPGMPQVSA